MSRPFLRGGDLIRIRGGVYRATAEPTRAGLADDTFIRPAASGDPGRPITVMAEPGEPVVLSGRWPAAGWQTAGGTPPVYYHEYSAPQGYPWEHPFQVVEDGRLVYRVASLAALDRPGRCFVDTALRRIWLRTSDDRPPVEHQVEYGVSAQGIEFRNVAHWRLTGFFLTGFRTSGVLVTRGGGPVEIDNMDISYIGAHRPGADPTNGYAIAMHESPGGNRVRYNRLHHTRAEALHISQTARPGDRYEYNEIYDAGGPEWLAEGDTVRFAGPGLILRASGMEVRGNRLSGNGYHGLIVESDLTGSEGASSPSRNVIEGNVLSANAGNGLHGDGKNGVTASAGNVIRFNLFERNNRRRSGSDADAELRLSGNLDDTEVVNNTIFSEHASGVLLTGARVAAGSAQGADALLERARLVNNIVYHAAPSRATWALRVADGVTGLLLDRNDWYRSSPGMLVNWNGAEAGSVEEVRQRTGQEARGLSVDPRFVNLATGHFWLRAISPVLGLGAFPYRPLVEAAPSDLAFVAVARARPPAVQTLTVASASGAPMAFSARAVEGWVRLSVAGGTAPATLAVRVDPVGLGAGQYNGTVQVTPALDGEPPLAVRVTLTVVPSPPRRRSP